MPIPDFTAKVPQLYYPKGGGPYTEGIKRGPYGKPTHQLIRVAMGAASSGHNLEPAGRAFNVTAGDTLKAAFINKKRNNSAWLRNASASAPDSIFEGRARYWLQFSGPAIDCSEKTYFSLGYAQTLGRASKKYPNAFYHAFATTPRTDDLSGTWPNDPNPRAAVDLISSTPRLFIGRGVHIGADPVWDVLECKLWNSTYEVRVTQVNHTVVADHARELKPAPNAGGAMGSAGVRAGVPQGAPLPVNQTVLDGLERRYGDGRAVAANGTAEDRAEAERYEAMKSYIAIMHAFGELMAGTIAWSDGEYDVWRTKILYTRLSEHYQFRKIVEAKLGPENALYRQVDNMNTTEREAAPPVPPPPKLKKRAMQDQQGPVEDWLRDSWPAQVEQLFMNIVMSLLSEKRFL
jgi:hypothetical protein